MIESAREQRRSAEVGHLSPEQTVAETRKLRAKERGNEIRRWQLMIMMNPVVAPAESKVRHR